MKSLLSFCSFSLCLVVCLATSVLQEGVIVQSEVLEISCFQADGSIPCQEFDIIGFSYTDGELYREFSTVEKIGDNLWQIFLEELRVSSELDSDSTFEPAPNVFEERLVLQVNWPSVAEEATAESPLPWINDTQSDLSSPLVNIRYEYLYGSNEPYLLEGSSEFIVITTKTP